MNLFDAVKEPPRFEQIDDPRLVQPRQLTAMVEWAKLSKELFIDYETTGLNPRKGHCPFSCQFFAPDKGAKMVDFRYLGDNGRAAVKDAVSNRTGRTIAFNMSFETRMSRALGFEVGGQLWDPMVAAYALNESRPNHATWGPLTQKALVHHELKKEPSFAFAVKSWLQSHTGQDEAHYEDVPPELIVPYGCEDVEQGFELYQRLSKQVTSCSMDSLVLTDSKLTDVVSRMEDRGLQFDEEYARGLIDRFSVEWKAAYQKAKTALGYDFDIGKDQQLFGILYGDFKMPMHKDTEKQGKLDKIVLGWMLTLPQLTPTQRAFLEAVLDWRELDKLLNTYLRPWVYEWQENGIVYPNLNYCGPETRRFSASDPNLQNVPTRTDRGALLRGCFRTRKGFSTYSMDESQAEFRFFTHYSKDTRLVAAYRNNRDTDIHEIVSQILGVIRKVGKNLNFGLLYGMGIDKLARELSATLKRMVSGAEAKLLRETYFVKIPNIRILQKEIEASIRSNGYVQSMFGGRRHLTVQESYKGLNTLMQMTVADLMRKAMVIADGILRKAGGHLLLQVHDEIPFELPGEDTREHVPTLKEIRHEAMENYPQVTVPLVASVEKWAPRWSEAVDVPEMVV